VARVLLYLYTGEYDDEVAPVFGAAATRKDKVGSTSDREEAVTPTETEHPAIPQSTQKPSGRKKEEMKAKRAEEQAAEDVLVRRLKANAHVYICADKLGLEKLKEHATTKFLSRLESLKWKDNAAPAVRIVYENTKTTDSVLRYQMTGYCVKICKGKGTRYLRLVQELERHERTAWSIAFEIQGKHEEDIQEQAQVKAQRDDAYNKLKANYCKDYALLVQARGEVDALLGLIKAPQFQHDSGCEGGRVITFCDTTEGTGTKQHYIVCSSCKRCVASSMAILFSESRFENYCST
jgi:hypothetical protein